MLCNGARRAGLLSYLRVYRSLNGLTRIEACASPRTTIALMNPTHLLLIVYIWADEQQKRNGMGNHINGGITFASRFCMLGVLYGS